LASEKGEKILQLNHSVQKKENADVLLMNASQTKERFPWLNTSDLKASSYGVSGEGWFDPYALLMGFRKKAISLGVTYIDDKVANLELNSDKTQVSKVSLTRGDALNARVVVNAAGPSAGAVAALIGIPLPVVHKKRSVFVVDTPHHKEITKCPLVIDTTGVYWRPEGGS